MIPCAPPQARWIRSAPRRSLPVPDLARLIERGLGTSCIADVQPLTDGLRNANFKVQLESPARSIVVRIYEHDPSLCQKELDLFRLLSASVPVPAVIHAEPAGLEGSPPYLLMECVDGITFHALKRQGDSVAISQAAFSVGETLAAIGHHRFSRSGWLGAGPTVTTPLLEGPDSTPRFVDRCFASTKLQLRLSAELRERASALIWSRKEQLADLDSQACLVHGDFGKRNVLIRCEGGRWRVVAVLDWEFAVSYSPLADIGHFLRYECNSGAVIEPYFSQGYSQAGGALPDEWRRLARVVDLTALCESLTHDDLPDDVVVELVELVRATVDNRDPVIP
jgi:aminoglycoside phosphotransferase (APT) family kinase protein